MITNWTTNNKFISIVNYIFQNEIEKHLQKFISNNLLIYLINLKIQEIDLHIQNLEKNVKENFIKKILKNSTGA